MNTTQEVTLSAHGVGGEAVKSGTSAEGKRRVAYFYDSKFTKSYIARARSAAWNFLLAYSCTFYLYWNA